MRFTTSPTRRRRLEAKGHDLRSKGDTEVLVPASMKTRDRGCFHCCGDGCRWRSGMHPAGTLVLARDRLDQKPLVYRHDGQRLILPASSRPRRFACEQQYYATKSIPWRLGHYLCYGYVHAPRNVQDGTHKLSPHGNYAVAGATRQLAASSVTGIPTGTSSTNVLSKKTSRSSRDASDAVREQMIADVPLGAFAFGRHQFDDHRRAHAMSVRPAVKTFESAFRIRPATGDELCRDGSAPPVPNADAIVEQKARRPCRHFAWRFDEPFGDSWAFPATCQYVPVRPGARSQSGSDRRRRRQALRWIRADTVAWPPTEVFRHLPAVYAVDLLGGTWAVVALPAKAGRRASSQAPTSVRAHQAGRRKIWCLGWMTTFDEAARMSSADSEAQLDAAGRGRVTVAWIGGGRSLLHCCPTHLGQSGAATWHARDGRRHCDLPAWRPLGKGRPGQRRRLSSNRR